jgi:hypothetical protein
MAMAVQSSHVGHADAGLAMDAQGGQVAQADAVNASRSSDRTTIGWFAIFMK